MTSPALTTNLFAVALMIIVIAIAVYIIVNRERYNREARSTIKTIALVFILAILFIGVIATGFRGKMHVNDYNLMWFPFILVLFILAFGKKIEEVETSQEDVQ